MSRCLLLFPVSLNHSFYPSKNALKRTLSFEVFVPILVCNFERILNMCVKSVGSTNLLGSDLAVMRERVSFSSV